MCCARFWFETRLWHLECCSESSKFVPSKAWWSVRFGVLLLRDDLLDIEDWKLIDSAYISINQLLLRKHKSNVEELVESLSLNEVLKCDGLLKFLGPRSFNEKSSCECMITSNNWLRETAKNQKFFSSNV